VTKVTGQATDEEPSVVYLQDTPMGIALEFIGVVLILLIVMTSTLLGCLVYPLIWLCRLCFARRDRQVQVSDAMDRRESSSFEPRTAPVTAQSLTDFGNWKRRA
jgi:hypothetical protein